MKKTWIAVLLSVILMFSGVSSVFAAPGKGNQEKDPKIPKSLVNRIDKFRSGYNPAELALLAGFQEQVYALASGQNNIQANKHLVDPVWAKISARIEAEKKKGNTQYAYLSEERILQLSVQSAHLFDEHGAGLFNVVADGYYRNIADLLLKLGGLPNGIDDVKYKDLEDFAKAVEKYVRGINKTELLGHMTSMSDLRQFLSVKFEDMLNQNSNKHLKLVRVIRGLNLTGTDLLSTGLNFVNRVDTKPSTLKPLILKGLMAYFLNNDNGGGNPGEEPSGELPVIDPNGAVTVSPSVTEVTYADNGDGSSTTQIEFKESEWNNYLGEVRNSLQQSMDIPGAAREVKQLIVNVGPTQDHIRVVLPGQAYEDLTSAFPRADLSLLFDHGSYQLPGEMLDAARAAKSLGVSIEDLNVTLDVAKVDEDTLRALKANLGSQGITLTNPVLKFTLAFETGNRKIYINDFGRFTVGQSIQADGEMNLSRSTAAELDLTRNQFMKVPTIFTTGGGKTTASFKVSSNGTYGIISYGEQQ